MLTRHAKAMDKMIKPEILLSNLTETGALAVKLTLNIARCISYPNILRLCMEMAE